MIKSKQFSKPICCRFRRISSVGAEEAKPSLISRFRLFHKIFGKRDHFTDGVTPCFCKTRYFAFFNSMTSSTSRRPTSAFLARPLDPHSPPRYPQRSFPTLGGRLRSAARGSTHSPIARLTIGVQDHGFAYVRDRCWVGSRVIADGPGQPTFRR